jgi:hypothetical protein
MQGNHLRMPSVNNFAPPYLTQKHSYPRYLLSLTAFELLLSLPTFAVHINLAVTTANELSANHRLSV